MITSQICTLCSEILVFEQSTLSALSHCVAVLLTSKCLTISELIATLCEVKDSHSQSTSSGLSPRAFSLLTDSSSAASRSWHIFPEISVWLGARQSTWMASWVYAGAYMTEVRAIDTQKDAFAHLSQLKGCHTQCEDRRSHSCAHLFFFRRCNKGAALEQNQQLGEYPVGSMSMTSSTANDVKG
jgi:hypothetical protein